MKAGSYSAACLAQQCARGSAAEGSVAGSVRHGYDTEKMEHVLCFQLLAARDSLGCQKYALPEKKDLRPSALRDPFHS